MVCHFTNAKIHYLFRYTATIQIIYCNIRTADVSGPNIVRAMPYCIRFVNYIARYIEKPTVFMSDSTSEERPRSETTRGSAQNLVQKTMRKASVRASAPAACTVSAFFFRGEKHKNL